MTMTSATKFLLTDPQLQLLFRRAALGDIKEAHLISEGEFNAIYDVSVAERQYILKIALAQTANVLTYEKDMLRQEVFFYQQMAAQTTIKIPTVYYSNFTQEDIPAPYFVMEKLEGKTMDQAGLSKAEKQLVQEQIAQALAALHTVRGDGFGYVQNGLKANWYDAYCAMVENMARDCAKMGKKLRHKEFFLEYALQHKALLMKVESRLVNFDLNDKNVIVNRVNGRPQIGIIDPERSFFGDFLGDFVCSEMMRFNLTSKKKSLQFYNRYAQNTVAATEEEQIRYYFLLGYMGMIMETEKYYRYKKTNFGYWRNVIAQGPIFSAALRGLKRHG